MNKSVTVDEWRQILEALMNSLAEGTLRDEWAPLITIDRRGK